MADSATLLITAFRRSQQAAEVRAEDGRRRATELEDVESRP
jgi:hypothetical protein